MLPKSEKIMPSKIISFRVTAEEAKTLEKMIAKVHVECKRRKVAPFLRSEVLRAVTMTWARIEPHTVGKRIAEHLGEPWPVAK